jgi:hypothetical protein
MSTRNRIAACAAFVSIACVSVGAFADDHAYTEGAVVNVARIRTVDGKFDDYMKWLGTTWKQQQEAGKKAGYIVSYQVVSVEPRTLDDPDLLLVTTYKNWASLDGALAKSDSIAKQVEGSVEASNQAQFDRAKIRRVLGSSTMQVLELK